MLEITGHTRVFGILADPIHQVKAPQGLNRIMAERGVDGVMVPFHVASADLATVLTGLRAVKSFGGAIVTVPHKTAIVPLLDAVSDAARLVGAVNAVRREPDGRLVGEILDGAGFVAGLRAAGHDLRGRSAYLAGAGGAANAIAFALAEAGIARLTVHNRTAARVEDLFGRLRRLFPDLPLASGDPDPTGHDLVVNATSLGLRPDDPLPLDASRLAPGQRVAEIIMQPAETRLLREAAARGCRTHPGLPMLEGQLALMADFLGMVPPAR
ncbi:shikimate dehydrogenase family protein [Methylobacterium nonmethylotrophicum]|uniref:shikimate dehydrogenase (NADP(+)) n=1 Tax=Methylobacterium nonmethylotrophicum TaxID=1141884 RepID=A0A4Z0NQJ3_9HYPH|nr:shikimate dehydrogenase [Methylobacterium nonmethylotrophicum]TGD99019.1 shikimate dehydrogenase [Methylobacterium nonmethylotrophicum]